MEILKLKNMIKKQKTKQTNKTTKPSVDGFNSGTERTEKRIG